ncbi:MAG: TldD/PmbA family protein [Defluviitaleaceae bacterium]|nr:TldD/PmbA family protein [Defluviitaleaceae bacterium]
MLNKPSIERIINAALEFGDFAEVFCERNVKSLITANSQKVETSSTGVEAGTGVRIFRGLDEIYVYTSGYSEDKIIKILKDTVGSLKNDSSFSTPTFAAATNYNRFQGELHTSVNYGRKLEIVNRALIAGKEYSSDIGQMFARYFDMCQDVVIANSEGIYAEDKRVKTRMLITAYAQGKNGVASGWQGPGAMKGFEFYTTLNIEDYAKEAARIAINMSNAEKCRGGRMPVIVANGFGGLIFHEACGHSLEASAVAIGTSEFSGKLGQTVASPLLTLVDDGTVDGAWGSLAVDDEGTPTQKNVLIENGVLKSYMIDKLNARRMATPSTGSGRRQNYRFAPTSRMTNTYIEGGVTNPDEIIANTERGLYVSYINGGSVNPATGDFNFAATESFMIENGKIAAPVSGATLIGNGLQVLKDVDMVGNNPKLGEGFCFAGSGALFISAGQPTVRVSEMTVGGVK